VKLLAVRIALTSRTFLIPIMAADLDSSSTH
jgi:hypothetical protein